MGLCIDHNRILDFRRTHPIFNGESEAKAPEHSNWVEYHCCSGCIIVNIIITIDN